MEYLENLSKLSPEEFGKFHTGNFSMAMDREDNVLFGYPIRDVEFLAIFGGGNWTWTSSGSASGNTANNVPAVPSETQTLYRRSTHDENGNAKQFTPAQNELWQTNFEIATMTHESIWKSAEEIANDANAYRTMTTRKKDSKFYSKDSASLVLEILANNGLVESKNA